MISKSFFLFVLALLVMGKPHAQKQPRYTPKSFVNYKNDKEFKIIKADNGIGRTFLLVNAEIWDTDDYNTTHVRGGQGTILLRIEGPFKKKKKNGLFSAYIIDSIDHSKLFKIWEQEYLNDKLNGEWRFFNLKGIPVQIRTYKNDSLDGRSTNYWIDGKSIMSERVFNNGSKNFSQREFYKNNNVKAEYKFIDDSVMVYAKEFYESGQLEHEVAIKNGESDGAAKRYYEDGTIMEESHFTNGKLDKTRTYYHPDGKVWLEQVYNGGLPWTIIANYDNKGNKREAGTLKDGNGTVIFYNDDGSIREMVTYVNGLRKR